MTQGLRHEDRATVARMMAAMGLKASDAEQPLICEALQLQGLDENQVSAWMSAGASQER